jgi:head-tail adaptor
MIAAGGLSRRCRFERRALSNAGAGEVVADAYAHLVTVWGALAMQRAREQLAHGQIEASASGVLKVRRSTLTSGITPDDRVVIDGVVYNIRGIVDPAEARVYLEMTVERGVA